MSDSDRSRADSWDDEDNAARYDAFARLYPAYQQTSRDLVMLAGPSPDAVVLDLACGTGATTAAILAVLGPDGKVIGADQSPAMLAMATRSIPDRRVRWVQAAAEEIDHHVDDPADAVVCNSAIWQTDLAATAAAVRNVVTAQGRFVFNVGSRFLERPDDANNLGELPGVMRMLAAREYGWQSPGSPAPVRPQLTRESICRCLIEAGFEVDGVEEFSYQQSAEAQRAWLSVPIFTTRLLPGMPYDDRMRVLDKAYEYLGRGEAGISRWIAFTATPSPGDSARRR
jgi:SAM-dependent methyltransferase